MIRRPPRSTPLYSSAASDVYKRQGRSNAGKSSALNVICNRIGLARTSKTPGRTQLINFFDIGENRRFVDLPGYGFSKVRVTQRTHWTQLIEQYYTSRSSLRGTVLLMDIRHPLKESDWQMLRWCEHCRNEIHVLLTKADKIGKGQASLQLHTVQRQLEQAMLTIPVSVQLFSSHTMIGVTEALRKLSFWL